MPVLAAASIRNRSPTSARPPSARRPARLPSAGSGRAGRPPAVAATGRRPSLGVQGPGFLPDSQLLDGARSSTRARCSSWACEEVSPSGVTQADRSSIQWAPCSGCSPTAIPTAPCSRESHSRCASCRVRLCAGSCPPAVTSPRRCAASVGARQVPRGSHADRRRPLRGRHPDTRRGARRSRTPWRQLLRTWSHCSPSGIPSRTACRLPTSARSCGCPSVRSSSSHTCGRSGTSSSDGTPTYLPGALVHPLVGAPVRVDRRPAHHVAVMPLDDVDPGEAVTQLDARRDAKQPDARRLVMLLGRWTAT